MINKMTRDLRGNDVPAFTFKRAMYSGISLTLDEDTLIHLSYDVEITVDGTAVPYTKGDKIVLVADKEYGFSTSIPLGMQ